MWHVSNANNRSAVLRLLPADCSETEIPTILEPLADIVLGGHITNKTEYADFWERAINSGANVEDLTSSQTAWMSFALNAAGLMEAVNNGDLKIDSITPSDKAVNFDIVFLLANANVGPTAIEARLKTLFGVEGATSLDKNSFASTPLTFSLSPTADGRVKATIAPEGAPTSFFLRVKVR